MYLFTLGLHQITVACKSASSQSCARMLPHTFGADRVRQSMLLRAAYSEPQKPDLSA
jgi:hypothetical protein